MASIYWRGLSAYLSWYEGGIRERKSLGQVSKWEAETARQAKEFELRTGQRLFKSAGATLSDFIPRYLAWYEAQFPSSYRRTSDTLLKTFQEFHHYPLDQITTQGIEQWKIRRLGTHSRGTVIKELNILSGLYSRAVKWRVCETHPLKEVERPRDIRSQAPRWFSKRELALIYRASGPRAWIWRLLVNTGIRASEAIHLQKCDIQKGQIHIVSRPEARTKSGKYRIVPLSGAAKEALKGHEDLLMGWNRNQLSMAFRRDARRAGVQGTLHDLRHTCASQLVKQWVNLRVIQGLLGHASIKTTERYAHVGESQIKAAVRGLKL